MLQEETLFKNFSVEDFEWKYDGIEYAFKAGSVKPMTKAEALHFAKHLVDREMMRAKLSTNHHTRPEYEAKAIEVLPEPVIHTGSPEGEPTEETPEVSNAIRFCDSCDSKGKRHMKGCTKEEAFEGLKENG